MTAMVRRSLVAPIGIPVTMATADDLDGVSDDTETYDVTGALRCLVWQIDDGTAGTAGVDILEVSHDGGSEWAADGSTVLPVAENDISGTIKTGGLLNAAGVEPASVEVGLFKVGPYEGPTLIRVQRDTSEPGDSIDWVTGAPTVLLIPIGLTAGAVDDES